MNGINKELEINKKVYTNLIIKHLEGTIADEMILNSFIRGIEISKITKNKVFFVLKDPSSLNVLRETYYVQIKNSIQNVFNKDLDPEFTLAHTEEKNNHIENNYVSNKFTFENYVEGSFNKEAINFSKKIVDRLGKYSPFFITSKSGLGKTHLLHAVGNEILKNEKTCMYIEPNKFTKNITSFSKSSKESISDYIEELKKFDVLLFDDIQNLGDRAVTLRVLFELLNDFINENKQIIIASDKSPAELSGFESRFITRFSSGLSTKIGKPTVDDLIKILKFKLKNENLSPENWEREALRFIARNNSSSIRSIEGAIKRVTFHTETEENIKYTYSVISNIFKELTIDPSELTPSRIIHFVASYYKINKNDIVGKSRKSNIVIARHMAIWLTRRILGIPYVKIGKIFGNRDHSTILSSIKTIDIKMNINNVIKLAAEKIERKIKNIS